MDSAASGAWSSRPSAIRVCSAKTIDVVAVVRYLTDADYFAYQMKYDSVHGKFKHKVDHRKERRPPKQEATCWWSTATRSSASWPPRIPASLPWKALGVDYVIESTGLFTDSEKAKGHLAAGAKKVIISAPGKGEVKTLVMGVNEERIRSRPSTRSSPTPPARPTAWRPLVHVLLKEGIGIETGLMTTIHCYTATQKTVDGPSQEGLARRTRGGDQHHPLAPPAPPRRSAKCCPAPRASSPACRFACRRPTSPSST